MAYPSSTDEGDIEDNHQSDFSASQSHLDRVPYPRQSNIAYPAATYYSERYNHVDQFTTDGSDTDFTYVEHPHKYRHSFSKKANLQPFPIKEERRSKSNRKNKKKLQNKPPVELPPISMVESGSTDEDVVEEKPQDLEGNQELKNEKRMLSFLFSKKVPPVLNEDERTDFPWRSSSIFKQIGFWWMWPVLLKGYKRTLIPSDLWTLPKNLTVEDMHQRFEDNLQKLLSKQQDKYLRSHQNLDRYEWPNWLIPYAMFQTFKWQYTMATIYLSISFTIQTLSPILIKELILFVNYRYFNIYKTYNRGIGLTVGAVLLIFVNGVLLNHFYHDAMFTGAQVKAVLMKSILLKSFKLSAKSKNNFPPGRITSLISTDLSKIDLAIGFQPLLIAFPIPIAISIAILLIYIGITSLVGIGLFIVSLMICVGITRFLYIYRQKAVVFTDARIGLMREVIENIKIIKFYAWELAYRAAITKLRNNEMKEVFTIKCLRNVITAYALCLPALTSMISFVTMWATKNMKTPDRVFAALSLFTILTQCIMLLPFALATGSDALIGFTRCKEFLSSEESEFALNQVKSTQPIFTRKHSNDIVVEINHADFVWESFHDQQLDLDLWGEDTYEGRQDAKRLKLKKIRLQSRLKNQSKQLYPASSSDASFVSAESEQKFPGLIDIDLAIKRNEFIMISGAIGSGKSSLLNAMAGFMKKKEGTIKITEEIVFCTDPWIQNATVRENILFGKPFDLNLYRDVVFSCALEEDFHNLPAGDQTEIGERGVNLSGGQKARVNLARACYSDAGILLLDDVLSAVDSRVGRHIIDHLFKGLLRNRTVILATHQLTVLEAADKVILMNGDGTIDFGTVDDLIEENTTFRTLIENNVDIKGEESPSEVETKSDNVKEKTAQSSIFRHRVHSDPPNLENGKTIAEEEKAINAIGWNIYKKYLNLGSGVFRVFAIPIFFALIVVATFFQLFTNTWLSFWTERKFKNITEIQYVAGYIGLTIMTVIFTCLEFCMLTYIENHAAQLLNISAVNRILHAPMSYMDTTPIGRILNRFSKDTDSLDNELGEQAQYFLFPLATIIGIIILCIIYLPWFAIAVPFLVAAFVFFSNFYQGSSREIKRLEAVQRSLVFNNLNETLTGMQTIQTYGVNDSFIRKNDICINKMNEAAYISISSQRWLCVNLDILAAIFSLIVCLLCITGQFHISPSSTGLLLSYVIQIVGLLSLTVRAMTATENEMNAVERLHHYAFELPQEAAYTKTEFTPIVEWPPSGYISFDNVSLRYRPNLPLVLEDFNLHIYPGEKVGICGRTGAGKSSIMNALYRLTEVETGKITIDGLDVSDMGLFDLRSRLSIIPQDPVLFQGTIRKNLDPFQEFTDDTLWDALRRSGLLDEFTVDRIRNTKYDPKNDYNYEDLHKFHLDQIVDNEGQNFSLGEKQLLALARALVRNSKILILDEATSSVDFETDAKIQETISTEFRHCTTLCIAHRLKTILQYDRIFVMDKGKVVEKGIPWNLYQEDGAFRKMCDKADITAEDFL